MCRPITRSRMALRDRADLATAKARRSWTGSRNARSRPRTNRRAVVENGACRVAKADTEPSCRLLSHDAIRSLLADR